MAVVLKAERLLVEATVTFPPLPPTLCWSPSSEDHLLCSTTVLAPVHHRLATAIVCAQRVNVLITHAFLARHQAIVSTVLRRLRAQEQVLRLVWRWRQCIRMNNSLPRPSSLPSCSRSRLGPCSPSLCWPGISNHYSIATRRRQLTGTRCRNRITVYHTTPPAYYKSRCMSSDRPSRGRRYCQFGTWCSNNGISRCSRGWGHVSQSSYLCGDYSPCGYWCVLRCGFGHR
jgi:hypothetical protein